MLRFFRTNVFNYSAKLSAIAQTAFAELQKLGGFSRDNGNLSPVPSGYMVSMPNCEITQRFPSSRSLLDYFKSHPLRAGEFWGGWINENGLTVLDVSLRVESRSDALELARIFGQKAIYSLADCENVYLPQTLPPMVHAGAGGIQAHSIGELYPWTIRGIGNPVQWQAFKMDNGQTGPIVSEYAAAEAFAKRAINGSAYDAMADIANNAEVIFEDAENVVLINAAEVW